ncbi:MAG: HEAT repeat domain-containing protein [Ignavibacteriae bacterium]|nr:HEAT repeat domain-containing protein [Ignavibacteriota bacterium]
MNSLAGAELAQRLTDSDPDIRRCAIADYEGPGTLDAIQAFSRALRDGDKGVRDAAFRALRSIGTEEVAQAVVALIADQNIGLRNMAGELLVKLGTISLRPLYAYLQSHDQDVRKFAVDVIGLIGNRESLLRILPLVNDPDENVVLAVIEAAGHLGNIQAVEPLLLAYTRKEYARIPIAEALGRLRDQRASHLLLSEFKNEWQKSEPDQLLLFVLIEALGSVGDIEAYEALVKEIEVGKGKLGTVLAYAAIQIATRWNETLPESAAMRECLLHALDEKNFSITMSAVKALAVYDDDDVTMAMLRLLGWSEVLDILLHAILKQRERTLSIATSLLETMESDKARGVIFFVSLAAAHNTEDDGSAREAAEEVERAFPVIARLWDQASEDTRSAIVEALFRLNGVEAISFLTRVTEDPDPWLRMRVIELLAQSSDGRVLEFVERFLEDEDEMVRETASATVMALQNRMGSVA